MFRPGSHGFGLPRRMLFQSDRLSRFSCNSIPMRRVVKSRYIVLAIVIEGDRDDEGRNSFLDSAWHSRYRFRPICALLFAGLARVTLAAAPSLFDPNGANKRRDGRPIALRVFRVFLVTRVHEPHGRHRHVRLVSFQMTPVLLAATSSVRDRVSPPVPTARFSFESLFFIRLSLSTNLSTNLSVDRRPRDFETGYRENGALAHGSRATPRWAATSDLNPIRST